MTWALPWPLGLLFLGMASGASAAAPHDFYGVIAAAERGPDSSEFARMGAGRVGNAPRQFRLGSGAAVPGRPAGLDPLRHTGRRGSQERHTRPADGLQLAGLGRREAELSTGGVAQGRVRRLRQEAAQRYGSNGTYWPLTPGSPRRRSSTGSSGTRSTRPASGTRSRVPSSTWRCCGCSAAPSGAPTPPPRSCWPACFGSQNRGGRAAEALPARHLPAQGEAAVRCGGGAPICEEPARRAGLGKGGATDHGRVQGRRARCGSPRSAGRPAARRRR